MASLLSRKIGVAHDAGSGGMVAVEGWVSCSIPASFDDHEIS